MPGLELVWGFPPPARRGPKPGHNVAEIVQAAMDLADAEGYDALGLPKIAHKLGLTANALYRYVSSKDELLLLLVDAGISTPPDDLPTEWRAGAAAWVNALIARYGERPWLLKIPVRGAPITPNLLRWLESLLGVFVGSGLAEQDWLSCAVLLDGYARSMATLASDLVDPTPVQSMTEFLYPLLRDRGFPITAALLAGGQYEDGPIGPDIEFGLARILDGIELRIAAQAK